MKEILYIYTRVSTLLQKDEGTSLEEQERKGIQQAKRLGMGYEVFNEGAKSASDKKDKDGDWVDSLNNRPVLSLLMNLVREGKVQHMFVERTDRLSRSNKTFTGINVDLARNNVTLYTRNGSFQVGSRPEDKLLLSLLGVFAEYDNELRTQRLKTGRFIRAKQGFWMLGTLPFGYKLGKNKKLAIDKEQSKWVEKMFKWYDEGMSLPSIKKKLDGKVETNRGNVIWTQQSIGKLLRNHHHKGYYTYLGVKISCPMIVDLELWERVNKRINNKDRRQKYTNKKRYDFPLSPLLVCGNCGSSILGQSQRSNGGEFRFSYCCSSRDKSYKKGGTKANWERGKYCPNTVSIECQRTEDIVWETLSEILKLSTQEKERFKGLRLSTKKTTTSKKEVELDKLKVVRSNLQSTITRIEEGIDEQRIDKLSNPNKAKSIDKFIEKLERSKEETLLKIQETENSLSEIENDSLWIDWINDYQDKIKNLDKLTREEKSEEIRRYVKKILVTFNEETRTHTLKLRLKLPLVGDDFKWTDKKQSPYKYKISEGSYEKETEYSKQG
jgi:site-specific DNA recombinase